MSFLGLIFKNPFRSKARASLAIIGISIGIATIVLLGAITAGLTENVNEILHAGGSDFLVSGKSTDEIDAMLGTEDINESWIANINNISGVKETAGVYLSSIDLPGLTGYPVIGFNSGDSKFLNLVITEGKMYNDSENEVIIGKLAMEKMNKSVNDTILLKNKEYKIVGIFESGTVDIDSSSFSGLKNVQKLDSAKDNITMIYAKLDDGADIGDVRKTIEDKYGDNITVISSLSDIESLENTMNMINGASWGISILAIIIGGVGVVNTMITSVYERTRELGVLKSIGWKNSRILTMILGESVVLTVVAGIIGSILGIIAAFAINYTDIIYPATTSLTVFPFIQAFAVAIIVGLIGGFYPAWKATRLQATEALGFE